MSDADPINFNLSYDDLANLALQRSGPLISLGGGQGLSHWMQTGDTRPLKSFFNNRAVSNEFLTRALSEIRRDVDLLEQGFDFSKVRTITSIGPGLCILELLVARRHPSCQMYLIDIEHTPDHAHGFNSSGSGYSSNATARRFLEENGVAPARIRFCNPRKEELDRSESDMIMSNLSMGFHYPLDEYVSYIETALPVGGTLIFDQRKGVADAGWSNLAPKFKISHATDCGKFLKLVCERQA